MAEFWFWADDADCIEVARQILAGSDYVLLPNFFYAESRAVELRVADERLVDALRRNRLLYIAGPFAKDPIPWNRVDADLGQQFAISPGAGGRMLSLRMSGISLTPDAMVIRAGSLAIASKRENPSLGTLEPQSDELKAVYADCVKRAKRALHRESIEGQNVWVGRHLLEAAAKGQNSKLVVDGKPLNLMPKN